jgi:hypothetical protein
VFPCGHPLTLSEKRSVYFFFLPHAEYSTVHAPAAWTPHKPNPTIILDTDNIETFPWAR